MRSCLEERPNPIRMTKWRRGNEGSWSTSLKPRLLHSPDHPPLHLGSCCSSSFAHFRTGPRERLAPLNRRLVFRWAKAGRVTAGVLLTSVCRDPLPGRRWGDRIPPPPWTLGLLMLYYWMLTMNLPCQSARPSNSLSVCCIACQSAPSAIVSLHSFRLCTDHHQPSWHHHWPCLHAHYNSIKLTKLFIFL